MTKGVALVTGASSGIGAELAKLCASDGYGVILVARDVQALEDLAGRLNREYGVPARVIVADLAQPEAAGLIFDRARGEPVDLLINNAGFGLRGAFAETDWRAETRMIQ